MTLPPLRPPFTCSLALALLAAAILSTLPIPVGQGATVARARGLCDVGAPYPYLAERYDRIVVGRPRITTMERTETTWTGVIEIVDPVYRRWPRGERRPRTLSIPAQFTTDSDCEYFPSLRHRIFILELLDCQLTIVAGRASEDG